MFAQAANEFAHDHFCPALLHQRVFERKGDALQTRASRYAARKFFAIRAGERYSRVCASASESTWPRLNCGCWQAARMADTKPAKSSGSNSTPFLSGKT